MRRPRMLMHAHMHRLQHKLGRSVAALGAGTAAYHAGKQAGPDQRNASNSGASKRTQADHTRPNGRAAPEKESAWKRAGSAVGAVADTKDKIADTAGQLREQAKDLPVNAKYALYHGKTQVSEGVRDFTSSVTQTRTARAEQRNAQAESRRQTIAERRAELEQAKQPQQTASESPKGAAPVHERPVTAKQPEDFRHHADTTHTGKPAMQPVSPSIRERGQVPYGGTVAERASVPVVKAASIHHEQIPPARTERQILPPASLPPDERQKTPHLLLPVRKTCPERYGSCDTGKKTGCPCGKRIELYHPAYHRQKGVDKNGNSGCQTRRKGRNHEVKTPFLCLFRRVRDDVLPAPFGGDCLLG